MNLESMGAFLASHRAERFPTWPKAMEADEWGWFRTSVESWHAIRKGHSLNLHKWLDTLSSGLAAVTPNDLLAQSLAIAGSVHPEVGELCGLLQVAFSTQSATRAGGETEARRSALLRAAAGFGERALVDSSPAAGASIAVRLARIYDELGDAAGQQRAWTEAVGRDPLLAWALNDEPQVGLIAAAALDQTFGVEAEIRRAVQELNEGERVTALARLNEVVAGDAPRNEALFLLALEGVRDAAGAAPRSSASRDALAQSMAHLDRLTGSNPAVAVLRVIAAVVALDRRAAEHDVGAVLQALSGGAYDPELQVEVVAAITEAIRQPPFDPAEILRQAYFAGVLDPLLAAEVPRGPLASFRRFVIGMSLASMMLSSGASFAAMQADVADNLTGVGGSSTVAMKVVNQHEPGGKALLLIPSVLDPDFALERVTQTSAEAPEPAVELPQDAGVMRTSRTAGEVIWVDGGGVTADRRQIPEGYWLSEMIGPQDVAQMEADGVAVVLSAVSPSAETLDALSAAGIEQITVRMGGTFRHANAIREVVASHRPEEILLHCTHGADRTGTMAAFLLIEQHGWEVADAFYAVVYPSRTHVEGLGYALGEMGIDDLRTVDDPSVGIYSPGGRRGSGGLKAHNEAFRRIIYTSIEAMGLGERGN